MNWSLIDAGTFDYAGDAWGYSYGGAAEWYQGLAFNPGVPDSMKSWASKCERVGSGDPAACTMARCFCCHSGSNDAIAGCSPKKPSRSSTDFYRNVNHRTHGVITLVSP